MAPERTLTDEAALNIIANALNSERAWTNDTLDALADVVALTGREVRDIGRHVEAGGADG